jgi:diguanylate cyclase
MHTDDMHRAAEFAHAAVASMAKHAIAPTPINFTVWYEYHAGRDHALVRAMDGIVAAKQRFTPEVVLALYEQHLSPARLFHASRDAAEKLDAVMDELRDHIGTAEENTRAYGDQLERFSDTLDSSEPTAAPAAVDGIVDAMLQETRAMQERNKELETKLAETTAEVTQLRRNFEQARREALTDPLTGLANRKAFEQSMHLLVRETLAENAPLSLLMLDIDHFKHFNDSYGHQTGDVVLQLVGRMLADNVKGQDVAARFGGEEFAILLPYTKLEQAQGLAESIRRTIGGRKLVKRTSGEDLGRVTISVGVAQYRPGEPLTGLVQRADDALYGAKHAGRDRVLTEREIAVPVPGQ